MKQENREVKPPIGQLYLGYEEQGDGWLRFRFSGGWEIHVNTQVGIVTVHPDPVTEKPV